MADLESRLHDLAAHLDAPSGDAMALAVTERLRGERPTAGSGSWARRRVAIAAGIAALVVGVGVAPAVADLLGLNGLDITITDDPAPSERGERDLGLGRLAELRDAPFAIVVPEALGPPDEVWIANGAGDPHVTLVWRPREGLPETSTPGVGALLTQFRGRLIDGYFQKVLPRDTNIEPVLVDGRRGVWISGDLHVLRYHDLSGEQRETRSRLAGDVLAWERGALTLRLETALGRDASIRIAQSVE